MHVVFSFYQQAEFMSGTCRTGLRLVQYGVDRKLIILLCHVQSIPSVLAVAVVVLMGIYVVKLSS